MLRAPYWPPRIVLLVLLNVAALMVGCHPGPVASSNEEDGDKSATTKQEGAIEAFDVGPVDSVRSESSRAAVIQDQDAIEPGPETPPRESWQPEEGGVDYSTFKLARAEPLRVPMSSFVPCSSPTPDEERESTRRGPHYVPIVKFFANDEALASLRSGTTSSTPIGATIVKEKWWLGETSLMAYAAMIKREAGYDPKHGDWEYVYVDLRYKTIKRGRIENCISCHSTAEKRDYLFRSWLRPDEESHEQRHNQPAKK